MRSAGERRAGRCCAPAKDRRSSRGGRGPEGGSARPGLEPGPHRTLVVLKNTGVGGWSCARASITAHCTHWAARCCCHPHRCRQPATATAAHFSSAVCCWAPPTAATALSLRALLRLVLCLCLGLALGVRCSRCRPSTLSIPMAFAEASIAAAAAVAASASVVPGHQQQEESQWR